jgi:hypothetical protein
MINGAFDLSKTYVHLGHGATATELPDFSWRPDYLSDYLRRYASDGPDGRLVGVIHMARTWSRWECHTSGDELVVQLTGRSDLIQEIDGEHHTVPLTPGLGVINRRGMWHTSDVHEPGEILFVVGGRRTIYRPRVARAEASPVA